MGMSFVTKLTVATMGLKTNQMESLVKDGTDVEIARLFGEIVESETGTSQYGDYNVFKGEFQGDNLISGESYRSAKMILPAIAEMAIAGIADDLDKGERAKFALCIYISLNDSKKGGTKFKYGVRSLMEPTQEDNLSKMAKMLPSPDAAPAKKSKK